MTTVLVTGANGFIGPHVCRRLAASGSRVLGLVRRDPGRLPAGVTAVEGDVRDADRLRAILRTHGPAHSVVHLATEPPGPEPRGGTNKMGTAAILQAAHDTGTPRVVFTSTMSVFDYLAPDLPLPLDEFQATSPLDAYGAEKLAAEYLCRQAHACLETKVTILRLAGVYGPGKPRGVVHNFLQAASQGRRIDVGEDRAVDLLWVGDAAAAIEASLETADLPDTLHIGSGTALRLSALADAAWQVAGPAGSTPDISVDAPGNSFVLDIGRARRHLGFEPTPLASALRSLQSHLAHSAASRPIG